MLSAAAVNKTFLAPHVIKWSGFHVIGESLLSVLQCQNHPYTLGARDEILERAILETPDLSEQVKRALFIAVLTGKCRNSMLNRMKLNLLRNDHIQNLIQRDLNG